MGRTSRTIKKAAKPPRNAYFSKVVDRGLRILELYRPEVTSLSLKDIAAATGINRTSAFRFIDTLVQLGYLQKDPRTKLVKLGPKALNLGQNIIQSFDLLQVAKPLIDEAFRTHNVTIDSTILDDVTLVLLHRREALGRMVFKLPQVLSPSQFSCTALGKACLSAMPEDLYARVIPLLSFERRTPYSLPDLKALETELVDARRRGYAVNDEEYILGVISLGAPIYGPDAKVLGAVSCDVLKDECSRTDAEKRYAPVVVDLAGAISFSLSQEETPRKNFNGAQTGLR
jgi:IclR family pca regulon transcriptional regulator